MYEEIGEGTRKKVSEKLASLGLTTTSVIVENISLPEDVEKAIDKRSSMAAIGDMNLYTQYQAADSIKDAAKNEGGIAGLGVGLGAGVGFGKIMGDAMSNASNANTTQKLIICPNCHQENPVNAKFCGNCGQLLKPRKKECVKCHHEIPEGTKFCPECGAVQVEIEKECPKCHHKVKGNSKFCPECGEPLK